ncbi:MAG: hypothetical protein A2074_00695 [Candidatus Aquicultor primus]|uniref:Uncharacterized protein n=1 Tax=Candidatus Aquicultor primus TaxID=1797195 RepID=A0A1F2UQF3_9ACTN|nr:MAG: hypothetical protein A2074_00695 [Candidatus Aquicultor primus]
MKKLLVLLLALAVLMSLSGVAFAGSSFNWKSGSMVNGDIYKSILFKNEAKTHTGDAEAMANGGMTSVDSCSQATALDDKSTAENDSSRLVTNTGTADAVTAPADALNQANNSEEETITEQAETHADCSMFMDMTTCCDECCDREENHVRTDSNNDHACDMCGCECCPASVCGDICIDVEYQNKADAKTGDATAMGNMTCTDVSSSSSALATNGGTASNGDSTVVTNSGVANAASGTAVSTNLVNNSVMIDIFRGAMSTKTIDVVMNFLTQ